MTHRHKLFVFYIYCLYFTIAKFDAFLSHSYLKLLFIHLNPFLKKVSPPHPSLEWSKGFSILLYGMDPCILFTPGTHFSGTSCLSFEKKECHFSSPLQKQKDGLYQFLKYCFPCFYSLRFFKATRNERWSPLKIKWIILRLLMKKICQ